MSLKNKKSIKLLKAQYEPFRLMIVSSGKVEKNIYCLNCSKHLNNEYQTDIVYQNCRSEQKRRRGAKKQIIRVSYCFDCGMPYSPFDASIKRGNCSRVFQDYVPALQRAEKNGTPGEKESDVLLQSVVSSSQD